MPYNTRMKCDDLSCHDINIEHFPHINPVGTSKFTACRLPGCRDGALPDPCDRAASGKRPPSSKHYHCVNCVTKATTGNRCPHCNKACDCGTCSTCGTGACCYGSAGPQQCKFKGCSSDVCKRCAQKVTASGKFSGMCTEHHGVQRSAKVRALSCPFPVHPQAVDFHSSCLYMHRFYRTSCLAFST